MDESRCFKKASLQHRILRTSNKSRTGSFRFRAVPSQIRLVQVSLRRSFYSVPFFEIFSFCLTCDSFRHSRATADVQVDSVWSAALSRAVAAR